ncbi:MAG: hypothetical protein RIS70_1929 [Planctomycetota bacterium]
MGLGMELGVGCGAGGLIGERIAVERARFVS